MSTMSVFEYNLLFKGPSSQTGILIYSLVFENYGVVIT